MQESGREGQQWLFRYLEDHLLGATGGVRLFAAASETWAGTRHGHTLSALCGEIDGERSELLRSLQTLGHQPNAAKMAFAHVNATVARLNPLNVRRTGKGPGAQLELEALQSLVRGKEALWETLLVLVDAGWSLADYNRDRLLQLADRARGQQDEIAEIMKATAVDRFRS